MRNVSRGTPGDVPNVSPILFRAAMREANREGAKNQTRRIVAASNSILSHGTFDGLDLEAARAERSESGASQPRAVLAAPCTYPRTQFRAGVTDATQRRIVEVVPRVQAGDIFWEKIGRFGSRAASQATYEVLRVDVRRVQDMTDGEAMQEGVAHVQLPKRWPARDRQAPRAIFAWLWDSINGAGSWASNPWVWVYHYAYFPQNVDAVLAQRAVASD